MTETHQHRNIRLCPENYLGCRWYFVTVCAHERVNYFRAKSLSNWVLRVLKEESSKHFFFVRAFCLMPDHLHLLLQGSSLNADLLKFMNGFRGRHMNTGSGTGRPSGKYLSTTMFLEARMRPGMWRGTSG